LETTFAIFVGGLIKGIVQIYQKKRKHNEVQRARTENIGILLAAGLIAGEALVGLLFAGFAFADIKLWQFAHPYYLTSLVIIAFLAWILIRYPLAKAGSPDEPSAPATGQ
jgi:hypothetical protein